MADVEGAAAGARAGARPAPHPSQRHPRDAAALILTRGTGDDLRILLGKRNPSLAFMPRRFVFPGGRVEAADGRVAPHGTLAPAVERRLQRIVARPSPRRARAYALAAIRELAEETGLLFGVEGDDATPPHGADWEAFARNGVTPSLSGLSFIARAVTPPGMPRRFDTRFFAADASGVAKALPDVVGPGSELVELRWAGLDEMPGLDLHPITRVILRELQGRIEGGLHGDQPVPFFRFRAGAMLRGEI